MFIDSNIMGVFFTADTHFGHKNVIKYCNRPYDSVEEMDEALIANWNAKVKDKDVVFHIGDFAFMKEPETVIKRLNGKIYLIPGNHDKRIVENMRLRTDFAQHDASTILTNKLIVLPELTHLDIRVKDERLRFVLCHYAMRVWNNSHYGAIQLFGHSHGTLPDYPNSRSIDVGVDCHGYAPIHLDDVLLKMCQKTFKPVDHHEEK